MNKLFFFIHICLILILAHVTAGALYKAILPGEIFVETRMENKSLVPKNAGKKTEKKEAGNTLGNPDGVIARNLFQVVTDAPVAVEDPSEPKALDDLDLQPTNPRRWMIWIYNQPDWSLPFGEPLQDRIFCLPSLRINISGVRHCMEREMRSRGPRSKKFCAMECSGDGRRKPIL